MEIKKRELEPRLYFASVATKKGYSVVIAKKADIWARRNLLRPGIVLFKSLGPNNILLINDMIEAGHQIAAWDEEAFVTPKEINYWIKKRINRENFKKLKYFFSWGTVENDYLCNEYPEFKDRIIATGNSRIDILKKKNFSVFDQEIKEITNAHGEFCLFLGNFGRINNKTFNKGETSVDRAVIEKIFQVGSSEYNFAKDYEAQQSKIFNQIPFLFEEFSKNFPSKKLIVRPHPSERLEPYYTAAKGMKNIKIIEDDFNTLSWIKASDFIISSNCTTSVEAFFLNKTSVNYFPFLESQKQQFYLPNMVSFNAESLKKLMILLEKIYSNLDKGILNELPNVENIDKVLREAFSNYEDKICSVENMIKCLDKIKIIKNSKDKNINFYYFNYYLVRSYVRILKENILKIVNGKNYREFKDYMKSKMVNFKYNEINYKFKAILESNNQTVKEYQVKEIIPKIFCFEKND